MGWDARMWGFPFFIKEKKEGLLAIPIIEYSEKRQFNRAPTIILSYILRSNTSPY